MKQVNALEGPQLRQPSRDWAWSGSIWPYMVLEDLWDVPLPGSVSTT